MHYREFTSTLKLRLIELVDRQNVVVKVEFADFSQTKIFSSINFQICRFDRSEVYIYTPIKHRFQQYKYAVAIRMICKNM